MGNANLLTKVYFPRLVIPLSAVLAGLVDLGISFLVLLALMAGYGVAPTWHIVFLPVFVLLAIVTALAVSLWLSAMNVLYRDVQYVIPFLVQLGMFVSPVIYPITRHPGRPVARRVRPEPDDRGHRRLSLGPPRSAVARRLPVDLAGRRAGAASRGGLVLLQACRSGCSRDVV